MSAPDITEAERQAVLEVLNTPNLSMGKEHLAFEAAVRNYTGAQHAIAVNSGTAGLHLCVRAAGIEPGDLVITTPFSFMASSNVLLYENAIPVFVDVHPVTGNIDPQLVNAAAEDLRAGGRAAEKWLPRRGTENKGALKALLPIDAFGQPADMDVIMSTAEKFDLTVIEDSCEAIGAEYKGRPAGLLGDMAVFAFYPNKQMTTAEGGMIVTNDEEAAELMRALRNQGRADGDTWLQHSYLGYNYRLNELSSALGRVQIGRLDELLQKRDQVAGWYNQYLSDIALLERPQVVPDTTRMSWFVYVVRLAPEIERDTLIRELTQNGIPARPYFSPLHLQPFMVERFGYLPGDFPITEDIGRRGLALPFSSVMTEDQVQLVSEAIQNVLNALK